MGGAQRLDVSAITMHHRAYSGNSRVSVSGSVFFCGNQCRSDTLDLLSMWFTYFFVGKLGFLEIQFVYVVYSTTHGLARNSFTEIAHALFRAGCCVGMALTRVLWHDVSSGRSSSR